MTSIVVPLDARTMSPGLTARPLGHVLGRADDGDDAHAAARAAAIAPTASSTAAPPDMSNFISDISRRA